MIFYIGTLVGPKRLSSYLINFIMNDKNVSSFVPALDKGLDILEFMAAAYEPHTLSQIARQVNRSVSEIQRMVACLENRAYLVRDSLGAYRVSSKLFRLAHAHPPFRDLMMRAIPPMEEYVAETNESVHVGILSEDQLLHIGQVEGRNFVRLSLQIGSTLDAIQTVSGRILLAGLSHEELKAFLERRSVKKAEHTHLLRRVAQVREQGFEASESEIIEGVHDLGVPVTLPGGQVIAALTTSWLQPRKEKYKMEKLLKPLQSAARRLSDNYEPAL